MSKGLHGALKAVADGLVQSEIDTRWIDAGADVLEVVHEGERYTVTVAPKDFTGEQRMRLLLVDQEWTHQSSGGDIMVDPGFASEGSFDEPLARLVLALYQSAVETITTVAVDQYGVLGMGESPFVGLTEAEALADVPRRVCAALDLIWHGGRATI